MTKVIDINSQKSEKHKENNNLSNSEFDFAEIMKKKQENEERVKQERLKSNKKVIRQERLKN